MSNSGRILWALGWAHLDVLLVTWFVSDAELVLLMSASL